MTTPNNPPSAATSEQLSECIAELYQAIVTNDDESHDHMANAHAKLMLLEATVAADARDAARYRWFRIDAHKIGVMLNFNGPHELDDAINALIDAALNRAAGGRE